DTRHIVRDVVIVCVQVERRQRVRRYAAPRERDVVAALEEVLIRAWVCHDRYAGGAERVAHRRSLVAGEPALSRSAGERIGSPDHLDLEIGDDVREGNGRMVEKPSR